MSRGRQVFFIFFYVSKRRFCAYNYAINCEKSDEALFYKPRLRILVLPVLISIVTHTMAQCHAVHLVNFQTIDFDVYVLF